MSLKEQIPQEEMIKLLKRKVYWWCHKFPNYKCEGESCPLHDVWDACETRYRNGTL